MYVYMYMQAVTWKYGETNIVLAIPHAGNTGTFKWATIFYQLESSLKAFNFYETENF